MTLLERLASAPGEAALFLDFDGVLAPIVAVPDDAYPSEATRRELERLAERYALVSVVSGREGDDVRRRLGVGGIVVVGSHGLELEPAAERWHEQIAAFARDAGWPETERKELSATFHFRNATDERAALATLEQVADDARAAGLRARFGRKVLEVLPPVDANKGTAIHRLLDECGLQRALVAGDDTTDIDAFRALDRLEVAVRVAVASPESPVALREEADVVVRDPDELLDLLRRL